MNKSRQRSILFVFIFATLFCITLCPAQAEQQSTPSASASVLPDAPQAMQTQGQSSSAEPGAANISGTVLDTSGDVLQGAQVQLSLASGALVQTKTSGTDGQFDFEKLPAGVYRIRVSANGMSSFTSGAIELKPGEFRIAPTITLAVSGGATSVTVTADEEQLAEQQVHIAIQQRIGGVIPNFYSAYDWDAPSMMGKQKFQLSAHSLLDPVSFLTVAGIAGAEQYQGIFPAYGSGIGGYGKRYGAALANRVSGELLGRAVYPAILHQDPRYFYKGKGTVASRALYAVSSAVITRNDNGRRGPNYSGVLGDFSAAALSNLYYPESDRGASLVVFNGLADIGATAVSNLFREFVLKQITSHVPQSANGQPNR